MEAVRLHSHGPPEVLKFEEVPDPPVRPGHVRLRIKACAVSHLDILVRKGFPGIFSTLPHIPGCDVSGVIEDVGPGTTGLKPGDEVVVNPGLSCGICEHCLSGDDYLCSQYNILGYVVDGGYATRVSVPFRNVWPKPSNLSFVEAACIPMTFVTAWNLLVERARVRPGENVLVQSAGSGLGIASIQICKLLGARVIATASTHSKLDRALRLGADEVINYSTQDFYREVKRLTRRKGVDVVVDQLGSSTFGKGLLCLARNGRMLTCGAITGSSTTIDLRYVFTRHISIFGSYTGGKANLAVVIPFFEDGSLRVVVDRTFPMSQAARAHARMEERSRFGKVVLVNE